MIAAPRRARLSFGLFEVDLDTGEIRRAGLRVKLAGQPFRVLATLIARHGEVVSHEELQQEIWGSNTNVDFERGIAGAINKVREALGDSADNPRFIETLAKRGYRFIAPVTVEPAPGTTEAEIVQRPPGETGQPVLSAHEAAVVPIPMPVTPPQVTSLPVTSLPDTSLDTRPTDLPGNMERAFLPQRRLRGAIRLATLIGMALGLMALASWATYALVHRTAPNRPPRVEQLTASSVIYAGPPNPENLLTVVSDGPRLYTSVLAEGRSQIASITVGGAQVQPVSLPDELNSVTIADISPDGSRLLVRSRLSRDSEQPLWIVPTVGSSGLRVGEVLAHDATWMPKANSILYAANNELGVAQLDTGAMSPYASLPGRAFWLRWSPDGTTLRFTLQDPTTHRSALWELDARTRKAHALGYPELGDLAACCGSWTADGKNYVFQASNAQESNIWLEKTGEHAPLTELTNGPLQYMSPLPARSGGGQKMYVVGLEKPAGTRLFDAKLHQFVPAPPFLAQATRVSYSRDGRWVAWTDNDTRLWRAHSSDGTSRLQLTPDDLEVFLAQWSPDGQQLVLMARKPGETWQIETVSAAGGAPRTVLADARNLADPDWSLDGREIVFGRQADLMGKESGPHTLQVLNLETHQLRTLPGSEDLFSPRWSPDGRWILALSLDQTRLLLYDVAHGSWRTIFTGSAADPVWSADSRAVYFHAFAEASSAILRLPLDGTAEPVADLSQLGLPSVDNYVFSGVTPGGAPIIKPRIGTGNLYSVSLPEPH